MNSDHRQGELRVARLPEIEVLRALAVGGVMIHHSYGNLLVAPHRILGFILRHVDLSTGVDLFFAISGFVIARSLLPTLREADELPAFWTVAASFWIRRAWRLLPSAWLWLLVTLVLSACFNRAGLFGSVRTNAWATVAGVLDFANVRFADAFGRYHYGASFAWWSLSLEEQFYLVLPPLAFLCRRWLPLVLLPIVAWQFQSHRTLLLMVLRTDAIIMGVLLACWERHRSFNRAGAFLCRLPQVARYGVAIGLLAGLVSQRHTLEPFGVGLMALFSTALVFLAAQASGLIMQAGAVRGFFVWAGARSYAFYLIHIPAYFTARELWFRIGTPSNELPVLLTASFILLICAELNWRWVERPLRHHGKAIAEAFTAGRVAAASRRNHADLTTIS
jgi:peptidoglycan/LPS O-acetylase OafA/YrhL